MLSLSLVSVIGIALKLQLQRELNDARGLTRLDNRLCGGRSDRRTTSLPKDRREDAGAAR